MDKAHEQAQETRRRNREIRQQQMAAKEAERQKDMELIVPALRRIIADPASDPATKLAAIDRLSVLKGYPMPRVKNDDALVTDFAERLKAFQANSK